MKQRYENSALVTIQVADDFKVQVNAELHGYVLREMLYNNKCSFLLAEYTILYDTTAEMHNFMDIICAFIMMDKDQQAKYLYSSSYGLDPVDYIELAKWFTDLLNRPWGNWSTRLQELIHELEASGKTVAEVFVEL